MLIKVSFSEYEENKDSAESTCSVWLIIADIYKVLKGRKSILAGCLSSKHKGNNQPKQYNDSTYLKG